MWYTVTVLSCFLYGISLHAVCDHLKAYTAYTRGDLARASQLLDAVIIDEPTNAQALYNKGKVSYGQKDYAHAEAYFAQATRYASQELLVPAWFDYGNALVQQKKYDDALSAYKKVLEYQPDHEHAKKMIEQLEKKKQEQQSHDQEDKNNNDQNQQNEDQHNQSDQENNDQRSPDEQEGDNAEDGAGKNEQDDRQREHKENPSQEEREQEHPRNNSQKKSPTPKKGSERNNEKNTPSCEHKKDDMAREQREQQVARAEQDHRAQDPLNNLLAQLDKLDESQAKRLVKYSIHGTNAHGNEKNW